MNIFKPAYIIAIIIIIITGTLISIITSFASIRTREKVSDHTLLKPLKLTTEEKAWLRVHPVISVGADPDWAPVEFKDSAGNQTGITKDYLDILDNLIPVEFEIAEVASWQDMIKKAKKGEIDLITNISFTNERAKFFIFTEPYIHIPIAIYTKKNTPPIPDIKYLSGQKVGVAKDYAIHDWLKEDYPDLELIPCDTVADGIAKLSKGDIFAFIGSVLSTGYHIRDKGYINIKLAKETKYAYNDRIAVPQKHQIFLNIIQKALDTITPAQRNNIYAKWISTKYEPKFDYKLLWQILTGITLIIIFFLWSNIRLRKSVIKRTKELYLREKQYRTLFETANDGMFILKGVQILNCNKKAVELFKFPDKKSMLGLHVHQLSPEFQPDGQSSLKASTAKIEDLKNGKSQIFEWQQLNRNGETFYTEVSLSPMQIEKDLCILAIVRDITAKRKAEEKIEELYKLKTVFLAGLSNEIRTPMNGILGFSALLEDNTLTTEEKLEYAKTIEQSGRRMLNVLNDLIDISQIESGQIDMHISKTSVNGLIDKILSKYKIKALSKGIKIKADKNLTDDKDIISIDSNRIFKVLSNLVSNAVKFTESGEINFGYKQKENMLEFHISDTGIGISKNMLHNIFTPFKKAENKNNDAGLGLSIAKAFIEKHNGNIWVESEEGKGSTFYFTLPYK